MGILRERERGAGRDEGKKMNSYIFLQEKILYIHVYNLFYHTICVTHLLAGLNYTKTLILL